ncbi:hypothetical protein [Amycolatopsis sp.]|uniref:hypothetical protein n=1 Tax=Amycolatopsis sp. TaxID=37632 RepID=UPI0039C89CBE
MIRTPGVSGFFGCTPVGPVGWTIALGSATSSSLLGALFERRWLQEDGEERSSN